MLSEFENNLNAELPILVEKRLRKLSLPKITKQTNKNHTHSSQHHKDLDGNLDDILQDSSPIGTFQDGGGGGGGGGVVGGKGALKWQSPGYLNSRVISVIDEASV